MTPRSARRHAFQPDDADPIGRAVSGSVSAGASDAAWSAEDAWLEAMRRAAAEALAALSPAERTAIEMAYVEGMSMREIAANLGEAPSTVTSQIHRGAERLRDTLERHEAERAESESIGPTLDAPVDHEKMDCDD